MLYINGFVSTRSTNKWKVFFNFQIRFRINGQKHKNIETNSQAWILIKVQCVIYQRIRLDKLYKLMGNFFKFWITFLNYWQKTEKNIRTNSEAWILIKAQCVIYQWIRLNKLYKLMESFFSNIELVFELLTENRKIFERIERRGYWSKRNVLFINIFVSTCSSNLWKFFFKFRNNFFELTTIF